MDLEIRQMLLGLIPSIIIAIVTAYLTVFLSFRKFRDEKRWEKKFDAYYQLFDAIYNFLRYDKALIGTVEDGAHLKEGDEEELRKIAGKGWDEIERAATIGSFILSQKTVNLIEKMDHNLDAIPYKGSEWYEFLNKRVAVIKECLNELQKVATKDLKVN